MAVHHEVPAAFAFGARRFGQHNGMAVGRAEARVEPDVFAMLDEPRRARGQVLPVLGLRGDAGEADVIAQLAYEASLMALEIFQYRFHAREYLETVWKAKQIASGRRGMTAWFKPTKRPKFVGRLKLSQIFSTNPLHPDFCLLLSASLAP